MDSISCSVLLLENPGVQTLICPQPVVFKAHLLQEGLPVGDCSWSQVPFLLSNNPS